MKKVKYQVNILGETLPYVIKWFDTKKEAKDFIKVLKEQDKILGCYVEYVIKEFEVKDGE